MEFETADKAIARLTDTANAFFGQDVTRAGLTGEFRGESTVQEQQRKLDNEARATEMFGGVPPTMMSVSDFRNSMDSVEGDSNYREEFDVDGDGAIGFGDWVHVTQNGTMMEDGRIAYGEGPRTLAGQQLDQNSAQFAESLGLDKAQFQESTRQFNDSLKVNMDQFMSSSIGQMVHTDDDGNLVFDTNPNTGEPLTTVEQAKMDADVEMFNRNFEESVRQFNDSFAEGSRQFDKSLEAQIRMGREGALSGIFGNGLSAWAQYKSRN